MLEQQAHALEKAVEGQVRAPFSSHNASRPKSPTQGVLQACPVIKRQIEHYQPIAPEGDPAGALEVKQHMTYMAYTSAELWELARQVHQRVGELIPSWLLHLWGNRAESMELSPIEMAHHGDTLPPPVPAECSVLGGK